MGDIHAKVKAFENKKDQKNMEKIESVIGKHCKNKKKALTRKEEKVCYYIDPIKRELSRPMSMGADPTRLCKKLERKSSTREREKKLSIEVPPAKTFLAF